MQGHPWSTIGSPILRSSSHRRSIPRSLAAGIANDTHLNRARSGNSLHPISRSHHTSRIVSGAGLLGTEPTVTRRGGFKSFGQKLASCCLAGHGGDLHRTNSGGGSSHISSGRPSSIASTGSPASAGSSGGSSPASVHAQMPQQRPLKPIPTGTRAPRPGPIRIYKHEPPSPEGTDFGGNHSPASSSGFSSSGHGYRPIHVPSSSPDNKLVPQRTRQRIRPLSYDVIPDHLIPSPASPAASGKGKGPMSGPSSPAGKDKVGSANGSASSSPGHKSAWNAGPSGTKSP
ncbi:unnamed protein product [Sympodiomycopsis kandeliae]